MTIKQLHGIQFIDQQNPMTMQTTNHGSDEPFMNQTIGPTGMIITTNS